MDKKSKVSLVVLLVIILLSLFATYYIFFVTRNYDIYTQVSCDPEVESCYEMTSCPDDSVDCNDPETSYYKILKIKAFALSYCDHNVESCSEPICNAGENCEYIKCNPNIEVGAQVCGDDVGQ